MSSYLSSARQRSGFTVIHVIASVVVLLFVIGGVTYTVGRQKAQQRYNSAPEQSAPGSQRSEQATDNQGRQIANERSNSKSTSVSWMQTEKGWQANGTPPACPSPLNLKVPANLSLATAVLMPGQPRGGNYKPHGGLRFDNQKDNNITVTVPMDAQLVRGARYISEGQVQYTFDFITPCGLMHRLGHLLVLEPKYQKIAETFPAAAEGDSRTNNVNPPVEVKAGEVIATQVGVKNNTFFDWGVYDIKQTNEAAKNATWASQHDPELAQHALCWLDLLSSADSATVKSLPPGDPESGKKSDFCK